MANGNGKIYIVIKEEKQDGSGTTQNDIENSKDESFSPFDSIKSFKESVTDNYFAYQGIEFLKQQGLKVLNYEISTIGVRTGEYVRQQNVQNAFGLARTAIGLGFTAKAGYMAAGPIGAAVGLAVGVASMGVEAYLNHLNTVREANRTNYELSMIRTRAGLEITLDGSRGTEG